MKRSVNCTGVVILFLVAFSEVRAQSNPSIESVLAALDREAAGHLAVFETASETRQRPSVSEAISSMSQADQVLRRGFDRVLEYQGDDAERLRVGISERVKKLDRNNLPRLQGLLPERGWFRISEVGKETARNAWLLVQHSDQDVDFQKMILGRMQALPSEEVEARLIAYLSDRVAMHEDRPQLYGTQGACQPAGGWKPRTIEDEANVDRRRADVGLGPLADYIRGFDSVCPASSG